MDPNKIIVRYEQVAEQVEGPVRRIIGFVRAANMLTLFDAADLEANPRSAKAGPVTVAISESIEKTPETFPFKTKGVLVGASDYDALDRKRYELRFVNPRIEGILDGGHNMLAIGTHILVAATGDERLRQKIKRWSDFKDAWHENRAAVHALKRASTGEDANSEELNFLVPLEILVPSDVEDNGVVDQFNNSLLDICAARNNNHELTLETRANKKGFYEELRKALPPSIAARIEWKSNESGDIRVRDLIALSWIPLSLLALPHDEDGRKVEPPVPQNIYRNKGECVKLFDRLMGSPAVSKPTGGEYTRELHNEAVRSALRIAASLPVLYDKIYIDFPAAYNKADGKFGKLDIVKMAKDMHSQPLSHFTEEPVEYRYPDGLIMPLVYGLKALMRVSKAGAVEWAEDPVDFLDEHLDTIVKKYRVILDAFSLDPQKIGKNEGSYAYVIDAFETEILRRAHRV
ncbi:hypothetical protein [Vitreimonas sp.]|uniref:hypothetical protein n=1 Tax=Vitreimonas sp. TaxID=3069702 RepID=UPI002ED8050F